MRLLPLPGAFSTQPVLHQSLPQLIIDLQYKLENQYKALNILK